MLVVALTGGIGSGKTTVARQFSELGVPVIDTDVIARQLVKPGQPALAEIVAQFGQDMLLENGELDRAKLADITFNDSKKRLLLESILHPRIRQDMQRQLKALQSSYAIVVIPLLTETNQAQQFDRVLLVDCPESIQISRVSQRDDRSVAQIQAILKSQASREQRLAIADDIIDNSGTAAELQQQVEQLHHKFLSLSVP